MRRVTSTVGITILEYNELTRIQLQLFRLAAEVRQNAQAPYSHYKVGCAVEAGTGIYTGVNVERNSWTQTSHAEQSAIDNAVMHVGPCQLLTVAVVGAPEDMEIDLSSPPKRLSEISHVSQVCPSCGHCLQIILENIFDKNGNYNPEVQLLGYSEQTGLFYQTTIGDAVPMPFLPQYLGTNYAEINKRAIEKGQKK